MKNCKPLRCDFRVRIRRLIDYNASNKAFGNNIGNQIEIFVFV